jgi:uncharacterized protein YlxW (UPF0749 family)
MNPESDHFWTRAASIAGILVAAIALAGVWQQSKERSERAGALQQLVTDQQKAIEMLQQEIRDIQHRMESTRRTIATFRQGNHQTLRTFAAKVDKAMKSNALVVPANARKGQ